MSLLGGKENMSNLIGAGKDNAVNLERVVAVSEVDSVPVKRLIKNAREMGMLVDLTLGGKTRSAIVMDSGHIILSIKSPETFIKKSSQKSTF